MAEPGLMDKVHNTALLKLAMQSLVHGVAVNI